MQVPFSELTDLELTSSSNTLSVIPDSFLGGSSPRLQSLRLRGIPFPGLPALLLSHLVHLHLSDIPHLGYISPEAIVTFISLLSNLESISLKFRSPRSRPNREIGFSQSKRSVIRALISLNFQGVIEYLEDFVARIDTPRLDNMRITFFNQIDFDTPRLAQFISRTLNLTKTNADVRFEDGFVCVGLDELHFPSPFGFLEIGVSCREPDWQLSSIEQLCNSSFTPLSTVEVLSIWHSSINVWENVIENTLWLRLLLPFTAVKFLYLSDGFAPSIGAALQELVGGRITEVLPSLQRIFVEGLEQSGSFQKNIAQFVAARRLSNHPVSISASVEYPYFSDWYEESNLSEDSDQHEDSDGSWDPDRDEDSDKHED